MFCTYCGNECEDHLLQCPRCGSQLRMHQPMYYPPQPYQQPAQGMAIASMILGIVSLITLWLGVIPAIVSICLGVSAKNKGNRSGMAAAGLVCGIISLSFWLFIFIIALMATM